MAPVFHSHQPQFVIDEETWEAFLKTADARNETVRELVAYAVELFMEREGFSPAWAAQPTQIALPRAGARRRRVNQQGKRPGPERDRKS
jgi:hypothetical protein